MARYPGEALGRGPPGFRELAGKGLVADDERQFDDLRLREMLSHPRQTVLGGVVEIGSCDLLGKLERAPLSLAEQRFTMDMLIQWDNLSRVQQHARSHTDSDSDC